MRCQKKEVVRRLSISSIRIKAVFIFSLLAFFLSVISLSEAQVCINCSPANMTVNEGNLAELPVAIMGGDLTGLPVDFYIWKTGASGQKSYFGPDLIWTNFSDFPEMPPLGTLPEMIQGAEVVWPMDTTGMESFTLDICFIASGTPFSADMIADHCGAVTVNVIPIQQCSGLYISDSTGASVSSVSVTATAGQAVNKTLYVKDSCGNPIAFTFSENLSWLTASSPQAGTLSLTMSSSSSVSGPINITSGGETKTINISLSVNATKTPFDPFNSGPTGPCTPSIRLWPNPASFSATSGGAPSPAYVDVGVTNSCTGAAISVSTSNVPSWVSVAPSPGKIRITPLAGQLPQSSTTAYMSVSSSGLPTVNLGVNITITGPCVPSSTPYISPSAVSLSTTVGVAVPDTSIRISNGCSNLDFTVTSVTGSWLSTVPAVNAGGTGNLTAKVNASSLTVGTYTGSIQVNVGGSTINIPVTVNVTNSPTPPGPSGGEIKNKQWYRAFYINPQEVQYYWLNASTSTNSLNIMMESADTRHTYNVDMLVKYIGTQTCSPSSDPKPTKDEYKQVLAACPGSGVTCKTQLNGYTFYMNHSKDSYETVSIPQNPAGCYYVMLYNVDTATNLLNLGASW